MTEKLETHLSQYFQFQSLQRYALAAKLLRTNRREKLITMVLINRESTRFRASREESQTSKTVNEEKKKKNHVTLLD